MAEKPYGVWKELRILRERFGWTSALLSEKSGVPKSYLSQLENGVRWPTATVTKRLADALRVPYTMLERPAEQKGNAA
jgi:transcriptional regulator with XRE-family HTH domain